MYLVLGLLLFLGVHSISIVAPGWRDRAAARVGPGVWRAVYSVLAIVGFVLLIWGYGQARREAVPLYVPPLWTHHVTALLMLPVFPFFFASHLPGRIKSALRHPMLVAVMLWAVAHLISNGTSSDVVLFGAFLIWAVVDRISYAWRTVRPIRMAPPSRMNDLIAVVAGLVVYVLFAFWLHLEWIGVAPFPR